MNQFFRMTAWLTLVIVSLCLSGLMNRFTLPLELFATLFAVLAISALLYQYAAPHTTRRTS